MNTPTSPTRADALRQLANVQLDLLVIGGGIVGSGVARDAAMRGLSVGLVDRHDFAFGTSSRSTRLLHGGLRYLEQGRVGLVHEASVEKKVIHQIAPHLALPLGFMFPAYKSGGRPLWQLRVGVKIYDLLCGGRNFKPSRGFTRDETLAALPKLNSEGLLGSVRYYDALTNDARLVIDTLRSAVAHGAVVSNYTRFVDAKRRNEVWECEIEDCLTGEKHRVSARAIVNATGPWAEQLPHSAVKLRLSKGIHLVVDRKRIPVEEAVVITEGKRILFMIPWGDRVVVGTTDTDYDDLPEKVRVEREDIAYVLRTVNASFPKLALAESDIMSSWAGLRPLIANPDGTPSDISRAHQIRCPEPCWWDIAGGKLTTYRLMAEQAVDQIVRKLGRTVQPCRTASEPLLPAHSVTYSGITPVPVSQEAVNHYVAEEWAISLEDLVIRRTSWLYYVRDIESQLEQISRWMAQASGWSESRRVTEFETCLAACHSQVVGSARTPRPAVAASRR